MRFLASPASLQLLFRRFVLGPLAEIAPNAVDPHTGRTVADLLANIDRRPRYIALSATLNSMGCLLFELVTSGIAEGVRFSRAAPDAD